MRHHLGAIRQLQRCHQVSSRGMLVLRRGLLQGGRTLRPHRSKATLADYDEQPVAAAAASASKSMGQFDWTDPLRLSLQLSEEETLVAQTAQAFAKEELLPGIVMANRNEAFDRNIMNQRGELGLLVRSSASS